MSFVRATRVIGALVLATGLSLSSGSSATAAEPVGSGRSIAASIALPSQPGVAPSSAPRRPADCRPRENYVEYQATAGKSRAFRWNSQACRFDQISAALGGSITNRLQSSRPTDLHFTAGRSSASPVGHARYMHPISKRTILSSPWQVDQPLRPTTHYNYRGDRITLRLVGVKVYTGRW